MNSRYHRTCRFVLPVATAILAASSCFSQPISLQDPYYKLPPPLVVRDGAAIVVDRREVLLRTSGNLSTYAGADTLTLPAGVERVIFLSLPDPVRARDRVVGLATAREGGISRYCIISSDDFGSTWSVASHAPFADAAFAPIDDFWRAPLRRIDWLPDGRTGWIWGARGIVVTTDGGATWETAYRIEPDGDKDFDNDERINAVTFSDGVNGVASMGTYHAQVMFRTNNGGRSWTYASLQLGQNRVAAIYHVAGEYRALAFDPFKPLDQSPNTVMYFSSDGGSWSFRAPMIVTHQTEMSRIFWRGDSSGLMVLRSGEIWRTSNGGRKWEPMQGKDAGYPIDFAYYPGTIGYGESIELTDHADGGATIAFASTTSNDGTLYRVGGWSLRPASAPVTAGDAGRLNLAAYPNPASTVVDISFRLPAPARVVITMADTRGEVIQQVEAGLIGSGENRIPLSLRGVPSGSYRYTLEADGLRGSGTIVVRR